MCALCDPEISDHNQIEKPLEFLPDTALVYNQPVYDESLCSFST